jgi:hypothetical protein
VPLEREPSWLDEPDRIRLPKDEAREALIADLRARERAALGRTGADGPVADGPEPAAVAMEAVLPAAPAVRDTPVRVRRPWGLWLAGAAIVLAGSASVWFFVLRDRGDLPEVSTPPVQAEPRIPPEPVGAPIGWSVAVEAHDRLGMAQQSVSSLAAADSSSDFYISPALVSGDLWYRVLAGPFADSVGAAVAMQRLVDAGLKRAAAVWDVRATPLAFLLGRFEQMAEANARADELMQKGIPAYVVEVPYSRGGPWYHVYGGAYTAPSEAERMGELLRNAGLPDSLVVRVGRTVP